MRRTLAAFVLLFSLSAAGVYVWKSSKKKTVPDPSQEHTTKPRILVSDEEVHAMRDAMLSTSKSGMIMSDSEIRRMLESQKNNEEYELFPKAKPDTHDLVPSSKTRIFLIPKEQLKKEFELEQPTETPPP